MRSIVAALAKDARLNNTGNTSARKGFKIISPKSFLIPLRTLPHAAATAFFRCAKAPTFIQMGEQFLRHVNQPDPMSAASGPACASLHRAFDGPGPAPVRSG